MLTIRHFDERALALYRAGEMRGTTHPYIGMEAVGVGVVLALRPDDYVSSTHRGHGHTIAKGATRTGHPCPGGRRARPSWQGWPS
jgi:TPP-dependent pyruvate/acetoin dehydrogenase alpha subunit